MVVAGELVLADRECRIVDASKRGLKEKQNKLQTTRDAINAQGVPEDEEIVRARLHQEQLSRLQDADNQ